VVKHLCRNSKRGERGITGTFKEGREGKGEWGRERGSREGGTDQRRGMAGGKKDETHHQPTGDSKAI